MHEVVEVPKLFGSLYLSGCSFENGVMNVIYSIMVPSHFGNLCGKLSVNGIS